jgi:geranylgeranyl diphosphate synthase type II
MTIPDFFEQDRSTVEAALQELLPPQDALPITIHKAMRYSVFAGGKRIRPILCMEAARMFSQDQGGAVQVGCALEFIHTYSLIHDDLPALDNDDLRRGKPTNHKVFGEAMAILAGDALLTLAFHTLALAPVEPQRRLTILAMIAEAAGTDRGMIGGQVADLEAEGKASDKGMLEYIHRSKTAALIRASIVAGAIAGGADRGCWRLARTSAGRFKWWTIFWMWKNLRRRWGKPRERIRRKRRLLIRRCMGSRFRGILRRTSRLRL